MRRFPKKLATGLSGLSADAADRPLFATAELAIAQNEEVREEDIWTPST